MHSEEWAGQWSKKGKSQSTRVAQEPAQAARNNTGSPIRTEEGF